MVFKVFSCAISWRILLFRVTRVNFYLDAIPVGQCSRFIGWKQDANFYTGIFYWNSRDWKKTASFYLKRDLRLNSNIYFLVSLVPRRSPPAHSTRLGAKCRDVTEWGPRYAIRWRHKISRQVVCARRERLGPRVLLGSFHDVSIHRQRWVCRERLLSAEKFLLQEYLRIISVFV